MKCNNRGTQQPYDMLADGLFFKERRQAYYHGKYHKRMVSLFILMVALGTLLANQNIF